MCLRILYILYAIISMPTRRKLQVKDLHHSENILPEKVNDWHGRFWARSRFPPAARGCLQLLFTSRRFHHKRFGPFQISSKWSLVYPQWVASIKQARGGSHYLSQSLGFRRSKSPAETSTGNSPTRQSSRWIPAKETRRSVLRSLTAAWNTWLCGSIHPGVRH